MYDPSFTVVMFSTSNILNYSALSAELNRRYCQTHGYRFVHEIYDRVAITPSHEKLRVISRHIEWTDYILWIDSDACVIDYRVPLTSFTRGDADLIIAGHEFGFDLAGRRLAYRLKGRPSGLNAGVFMLRNSAWTAEFLRRWWELCIEGAKVPTALVEQGQLQAMLEENTCDLQGHIELVVPCSRLNRCDDRGENVCEFILHLWGSGGKERERVFSELLQGRKPDIPISLPSFDTTWPRPF